MFYNKSPFIYKFKSLYYLFLKCGDMKNKKMKVLIVTQYFWPENFRINDLAIELKRKDYKVSILTAQPNYPSGKIFSNWYKKNWKEFL